eukprot:SAG11_NODE_2446_length_3350_cov_8.725008_1_plen_155_part_00
MIAILEKTNITTRVQVLVVNWWGIKFFERAPLVNLGRSTDFRRPKNNLANKVLDLADFKVSVVSNAPLGSKWSHSFPLRSPIGTPRTPLGHRTALKAFNRDRARLTTHWNYWRRHVASATKLAGSKLRAPQPVISRILSQLPPRAARSPHVDNG